MYLSVAGGTQLQRKITEDVAHWAANQLLGRLSNKIEIDIELRRISSADGICEWLDDNINPREFKITLRTGQKFSELIITILHEMTHIKQYARGYLEDHYDNKVSCRWKNKDISSRVDYDDQPWEKEAYAEQGRLAKKFIKDTNFGYTKEMKKIDKNKKSLTNNNNCSNLHKKYKKDSKIIENSIR